MAKTLTEFKSHFPMVAAPWLANLFIAVTIGLVLWIYQWTPSSFPDRILDNSPNGYYNELADAFLNGRLSLSRLPDSRLVALGQDAYDPVRNREYRVDNLSYFGGRYFLYMGPAPALTVFIPVHLLTGRYLNPRWAAKLFCSVGFLAGSLLLLQITPRPLNLHATVVLCFSLLAVGLAGGFYVGVASELTQALAVDSAFAFGMIGLYATSQSLLAMPLRVPWLFVAGLAYGLAVASRPNYLIGSIALLPTLVYLRRRLGRGWSSSIILLSPLGVCLMLLATYNYARFGAVFEFGARYQLGGWDQRKLAYLSLHSVKDNLYWYLWGPGVADFFFPFVRPSSWTAIGVVRYVPWLWLLPVVSAGLYVRQPSAAARTLALSTFLLAAGNFTVLTFLPSGNFSSVTTSANARYVLDFLPYCVLYIAIILSVCDRTFARPITTVCVGLLALASAIIGLSLHFTAFPSGSYRTLARLLDWIPSRLQSAAGVTYGPLAIDLRFPSHKVGLYEPIVSTGSAASGDLIYVYYESTSTIRFGHIGTQVREPLGQAVPINYAGRHHITIKLGSLYPPSGHPLVSALTEAQLDYMGRRIEVRVDNQPALEVTAHVSESSPEAVHVGTNQILPSYSALRFSGEIFSVGRMVIAAPAAAANPQNFGPAILVLKFPRDAVRDAREPLLGTGVSGAGDLISVEYRENRAIRLYVDHWGNPPIITRWLNVDFSQIHTVRISLGSLLADRQSSHPFTAGDAGRQAPEEWLSISVDGDSLLNQPFQAYQSSPFDVAIGINAIGATSCSYAFTGRILRSFREAVRSK